MERINKKYRIFK